MSNGRFGWYAPRVLALVAALFGTSFFMIFSDVIGNAFQSVARLEVSPAFTGGRIAAVAYDAVGDDHGYGGLVYPANRDFARGSLDLVRYTVHEPVFGARWSDEEEYWQLDLDFAAGPVDGRNVWIYVDADGDGKGATFPPDEMAEGVAFDPASPWDYAISVHGKDGKLISADGTIAERVRAYVIDGGKKVVIRVPLANRALQGLYAAGETRHYVVVGGWSPWGRDGFMPVARRAGMGTGGGASSPLAPKVYDCLAPEGKTQEGMLSAWDDETLSIPVLYPVAIAMRSASFGGLAGAGPSRERIAELEGAIARENEDGSVRARRELEVARGQVAANPESIEPSRNLAVCLFRAGVTDEAATAFDAVLAKLPDDPVSLAYKGALIALRAKDQSPLEAVGTIKGAYEFLDRAVALAKGTDEVLTARYSRANVSKSVPNAVFGKAREGSVDYLACAGTLKGLAEGEGNPLSGIADIAEAYCDAAICLEIAGGDAEAGTWFHESARLLGIADSSSPPVPVSSRVRLELARRGLAK